MFIPLLPLLLWSTVLFHQTEPQPLHNDTQSSDNGTLPLFTSTVPTWAPDSTGSPTRMPENSDSTADTRAASSQPLPSVQSVANTSSHSKGTPTLKLVTDGMTVLNFSVTSSLGASRTTSRPAVMPPSSTQHSVQSTPQSITASSESTMLMPHTVARPPGSTHRVPGSSTTPTGSPYFHPETSETGSTLASSSSMSLSADSTSSTGVLVPNRNPKWPLVTTTSTTRKLSTTPPRRGREQSEDISRNLCSLGTTRKDGLVSQCLIAIASLAAVATIFIVTTIVLCTRLSTYKHRYRMSRSQGTEMVCISNMLPDGDVHQARPHHPKSNGALIPSGDDSDGDDLTLHSFLPENDRAA